jgi:N-acetylneuraminate synthase/N,N'-diacetyllegionaminate synthase
MNKSFYIGSHQLGLGHPALVIAEAGVNHNGDVDMAAELIRAARRAGADCVKFQTFKAERVVTADAPKANYQMRETDPRQSQLAMLRSLELSESAYGDLIALCATEGLMFTSTPYNEEDVAFLHALDVPVLKSASMHLTEPRFLQRMAETGRPLIVSTGMATWDELYEAVQAIRATGNDRFVLLQCTTNYPSLVRDTHLHAMVEMGRRLQCLVGYSDHTQSHVPCLGAVAMSACVIEKHFTLDKSLVGPDHSTSETPEDFARLVQGIRTMEEALGGSEKQPTDAERANMLGMRRSIVARRSMPAGYTIADEDLTCKRPASGIAPKEWPRLVGRKIARPVAAGALLQWDDLHA